MFGMVNTLVTMVGWAVFFGLVAFLAWLGVVVARKVGAGPRGRRWTGIVVGVLAFVYFNGPLHLFLTGIYFDHLCETEAGDVVYRTVDNVEGFYLMRLRDPRDYLDRVWARDPPEDPFGHTDWEAQRPGTLFVNPPWMNYRFIEIPLVAGPTDDVVAPAYFRLSGYQAAMSDPGFVREYGHAQKRHPMVTEPVSHLRSRFGYSWAETSTKLQLKLGIHRGEQTIVDLATGNYLARKVGFVRLRGGGYCPGDKGDTPAYDFVSKVLRPPQPSIPGR